MRRFLSIAAVVLVAVSVIRARPGLQTPAAQAPAPVSASEPVPLKQTDKKLVYTKYDLMGPVAPGDSAIFMVGNFAAQHNGALIISDSAVRYSESRIEFFGHVIINKNTTYIYGDRAEYDRDRGEARVFSDLVKVVDGDATLYTYNFVFNTKTNIGRFYDGGIMTNRDSRLESVRGYYYSDAKELICVDQVEMRNDEYELKGDSVVYNTATDNAFFFERTNLWSKDGDYLYADRGEYQKADSLYIVTRNGYVLTEKQEMWSDSIDFYRAKNHVILRRNIQIDDTEHKVLAFGEYGEYWKEPGNALLTQRPSVVSYDNSQGDSLFMRADSMFLYTLFTTAKTEQVDSAAVQTPKAPKGADSLAPSSDSLARTVIPADSLGGAADSLGRNVAPADSLSAAKADTVQLTPEQQKTKLREQVAKEKAAAKIAAAKAKKEELAKIAAKRKEKATAKRQAQAEREEKRLAAQRLKISSKMRARVARAARKGKIIPLDSTEIRRIDSLILRNDMEQDSLLHALLDSMLTPAPVIAADSTDSLAVPLDSMYRLIKGYRNVRIYRSDSQSVCDSMTAISIDSTIHLYINPVLWNQSNQITSDVMDIYTQNQQITRAEFVGSPMMVSELDTVHYNQIAGKTMTAFFREGEIYRNDVNANVETIYYMQDGEPPVITSVAFIESGDASFYIDNQELNHIVYRVQPVFNAYPMDKIPADRSLRLKGLKWEGARRPTQADVFDRTIRPSIREAKSRLRHPDFPIMQRIEEHKKRLIQERRWFDRNDKADPETIEWMRRLGFEVGQPRESGPAL